MKLASGKKTLAVMFIICADFACSVCALIAREALLTKIVSSPRRTDGGGRPPIRGVGHGFEFRHERQCGLVQPALVKGQ